MENRARARQARSIGQHSRWPLAIAVCAIYCGNYVLIINARLTAVAARRSGQSGLAGRSSQPVQAVRASQEEQQHKNNSSAHNCGRKYWVPKACCWLIPGSCQLWLLSSSLSLSLCKLGQHEAALFSLSLSFAPFAYALIKQSFIKKYFIILLYPPVYFFLGGIKRIAIIKLTSPLEIHFKVIINNQAMCCVCVSVWRAEKVARATRA